MVNKCSIVGCFTNYSGYDKGTVFSLPQDEIQRQQWIKFVNRKDHSSMKIFVCFKHFRKDVLAKTSKGVKLITNLNPVPTIIPDSQKIVNLPSAAIMETIKTPRKPPKIRIFQEDQLGDFKKKDAITCLDDIDAKGPNSCEKGIKFERQHKCLLIYKMECNERNQVPQVSYCIHVDETLHVKLFCYNAPMALPTWFRKGRNSTLTNCSMLQNLLNHMKLRSEQKNSILSELQQMRYSTRNPFPAHVIRYALYLRHTSLQAYKLLLEEFPLPSVSYLRSLTNGEY